MMARTPGPGTNAARWCAGVAAAGFATAGAFHVVWAFSPWPLTSWWDWNRTVMGTDDRAVRSGPSWALSCFVIAALLLAAAGIVAACAALVPRFAPWWALRIGAGGVVLVLLGRGALGLVASVPEDLPCHRWNLLLYSPLCLVLAALSAVAAVLGPPVGRRPRADGSPRQASDRGARTTTSR